MTDDIRKSRRRLEAQKPASYEVGYGRPPRATQFQKGRSGNEQGRPPGAKSKKPQLNEERLKDIILSEAYRDVAIRDGDRNVTIPMAVAILRSIAVNAAKGNPKAQKMFTEMLEKTELDNERRADEWLQTVIEYKTGWTDEIERCKRLGLPLPKPLPHPDDIEINMNTGVVVFKGPFTPEEKAWWEALWQRREECVVTIKDLQKKRKRSRSLIVRAQITAKLESEWRTFDQIIATIKASNFRRPDPGEKPKDKR